MHYEGPSVNVSPFFRGSLLAPISDQRMSYVLCASNRPKNWNLVSKWLSVCASREPLKNVLTSIHRWTFVCD
jgi:hypothetical protein